MTIELVRRRLLREEYSVLWLSTSLLMFVLVSQYEWLEELTQFIGAVLPTTTLFIGAFLFLLLIVVQFSIKLTRALDTPGWRRRATCTRLVQCMQTMPSIERLSVAMRCLRCIGVVSANLESIWTDKCMRWNNQVCRRRYVPDHTSGQVEPRSVTRTEESADPQVR